MSNFNGIEAAELYASNKSSSSVFKEAHKKDFLAGYNKALEDSCAPEMLEMLENIEKEYNLKIVSGIDILKLRELIKKETE